MSLAITSVSRSRARTRTARGSIPFWVRISRPRCGRSRRLARRNCFRGRRCWRATTSRATIQIGQNVPLITNVRYDTFGNAINSVTYQPVGIILKVTPFVTSDGLVQMIVQPSASAIDPSGSIPISAGVTAPIIDVRSADTVVLTPDGQTVVIGGLMRNDTGEVVTKIPVLGDIPLLGNLFKHKTSSSAKTELLIFLTPHVIAAPKQLAAMSSYERQHMLLPKSYSEEELDRFLDKVTAKKPDDAKKK